MLKVICNVRNRKKSGVSLTLRLLARPLLGRKQKMASHVVFRNDPGNISIWIRSCSSGLSSTLPQWRGEERLHTKPKEYLCKRLQYPWASVRYESLQISSNFLSGELYVKSFYFLLFSSPWRRTVFFHALTILKICWLQYYQQLFLHKYFVAVHIVYTY